MMWQAAIAGLSLGLLGSFHCVGMCGPLALALPVHHLSRRMQLAAILLYNLGRVSTYTVFGLFFGMAGRPIYIAGWQQWFSIAAGVFVLCMALQYFFLNNQWQPRWLSALHKWVQRWMSVLLQSPRTSSFFMLGLANGLLPCGMLYLAIAASLSSPGLGEAVLFMGMFGAGTFPAMMALSFFGLRIRLAVRQQLKKAMPFLMALIAIVLILRGMNLGIPFISPVMANNPAQAAQCH